MSRSPLSFVSKFLSRSPALAADTLSVAASFPEQGVSIALGYLAVALGILSWETVDQWLTDQKIQDLKDRASTTDKYVRDVKSLIQLVRARTWPAIENLIQVL